MVTWETSDPLGEMDALEVAALGRLVEPAAALVSAATVAELLEQRAALASAITAAASRGVTLAREATAAHPDPVAGLAAALRDAKGPPNPALLGF